MNSFKGFINQCDTKRPGLLSFAEKSTRTIVAGGNSPLSVKAKEHIQKQSSNLQEAFQELYGKLQVLQRRLAKIQAHWCDYQEAQTRIDNYLQKVQLIRNSFTEIHWVC